MKSITTWGSKHRKTTRFLITIFSIIAGFLAFLFGVALYANGFSIPMYILTIVAFGLILPFLLYPTRKQKQYGIPQYLKKRMFADALIYGLAFFLFAGFGNHRAAYWDVPTTTNEKGMAVLITHSTPVKLEQKKTTKQTIREQFKKAIKFFKTKKQSGRALRYFLFTLLLAALGTGMIALGCSIACSSGSAFGSVLMILGLGAYGAGAVFLVLSIIAAIKGQ